MPWCKQGKYFLWWYMQSRKIFVASNIHAYRSWKEFCYQRVFSRSVEDRYKNICETAKSRSILSLGMSCFQQMASLSESGQSEASSSCNSQSGSSYIVQTFNIMLLCEEEFVVEPLSLRFLVQHGFDFNKQYEKGIPYYRGVDKVLPIIRGLELYKHI